MSNFIGPGPPPYLKNISEKNKDDKSEYNEDDVVTAEISDEEYREDVHPRPSALPEEAYGPALPPGFKPHVTGPATPPSPLTAPPSSIPEFVDGSSENDDEIVGPMPVSSGSEIVKQQLQQQLESRAHKMKERLAGKDASDNQKIKRESWMLELPPEKAVQFGLSSRQFRTRAKPSGDRSVWTDTPEVREQKALHQPATSAEDLKHKALKHRDQQMEKLSEGQSSKRPKESLLESHQKKLKRDKKASSSGKEERRPFDRDIDLQASRFDEAQKKSILKKAQMLDDRFAGGESKYL